MCRDVRWCSSDGRLSSANAFRLPGNLASAVLMASAILHQLLGERPKNAHSQQQFPASASQLGTPMTALRNSFSPARCVRQLTVGCTGALQLVCHTSATHSGKTNTASFLPTAVKLPRPARCTACVEALALWPQPKSLHIGSTTEADSCTLVVCMSGVCSLW